MKPRIDMADVQRLRQEGMTWPAIGKKLQRDPDGLRKRHKRWVMDLPLEAQVEREIEVAVDDIHNPRIQSLLQEAEVNLDIWKPVRAVVNRWGSEEHPSWQAKVWLQAIKELKSIQDLIPDFIRDHGESLRELEHPLIDHPAADDGHTLEVSPFDLHIGKQAWGEETGEDYDTHIAERRFKTAVLDLLQRGTAAYEIDKVLFPYGNDLLHVDNRFNTTTAGTPQDTDSRYHKMFRSAVRLGAWAIMAMREIAEVKVVIVPGNHDELGTFMVGEVLSAMFANDALVTIDNRPMLRKYHSYGNVLLGFTHGGEEKHAELPSIMADEARDLWAKADHREWHIGHFHKKKELRFVGLDAFRTTVVRVLPSLCGTDAWHYKKGYKHTPQAQAFVWHPEDGLADTLTHTPKP